jgi:hypothetical protein
MARIRSVKPEYWTSEQVMHMSRDARLLFIGLWNFCDDNGIHPASALTLKAQVFPADLLTADQVMAFVDEMIEQGLVEEYEAGGRAFWRVTGWHNHQRIEYPTFRHPTADAQAGEGSDTSDAGDAKGDGVTCVTSRTYKRLGGKQRQIVLRKLRERDGEKCSVCDNPSNLSILSLAAGGEENASNISDLRLICSTCKRANKQGDAKKSVSLRRVTTGDTKGLGGDSETERKGKEGKLTTNSPKPPGGGLPAPKERTAGIALQTFLDECKAKGERPLRDYAPLWQYAEDAGLPQDFVALAWIEFSRRFGPGGVKEARRQKNWRQTFRNYVEGNYLKLWAIDTAGTYFLTTQGKQAQKIYESREAA